MEPISVFSARTVAGRGRGRGLGTPTINCDLADVPTELEDGVYACVVAFDGETAPAAMHLGPRPVFRDTRTCEVHLLDRALDVSPKRLDIRVIERLRDVLDFPSPEALRAQITDDIRRVRAILGTHA